MNARLIAAVCCLATIGSGLAGCAGNPARETDPHTPEAALPQNLERLPQILLPGAVRAEVKSFAMGTALSKGWTLSQSAADRLVVQRALDPRAVANLAPATAGPLPAAGTQLEVTSYFIEQPDGVKVATRADLIAQAPAGKPPIRIDYTETLRDSLLAHSLHSLRDAWAANRGRIARATPPAEGWKDAWGNPPANANTAENVAPAPPPAAIDRTAALPTTPRPQPNAQPLPPPRTHPVAPPVTRPSPPPAQRVAEKSAPIQRSAEKPSPVRAAPEARRPAAGPAPVVDGMAASVRTAPPPRAPAPRAPLPSATPPRESENMMTLPPPSPALAGDISWAASAEQYAREHGCQVGGQGTELIESRADGEVHKVPCVGSDSFLIKCHNGSCRGLL